MAHDRPLVNLENVSKAYAHDAVLDGVSLGVGRRRADRRGRPQRRRQDHAAALLTGRRSRDAGRVTHDRRPPGRRRSTSATDPHRRRPSATPAASAYGAEHEWAGDAARAGGARPGSGCRGSASTPGRAAVRRRAPPGRAGRAAGRATPTCWCWTSRPTTSTSRAWPGWPAPASAAREALVVVTHDRWFLDEVSEQTWEVARRHGATRYDGGYSAYVLARAERARQAAAAEARRQNLLRKELAWLRRGPPARTSKPQVPDRRGQRADRRRAAAAGRRRAAAVRHRAGSARGRTTSRTSRSRVGDRMLLDDVPGGSARATGSGWSASTAPARRRCCGCCSGAQPDAGRVGGQTVRAALPVAGRRRAAAAAAGAGGGRAGRPSGSTSAPAS